MAGSSSVSKLPPVNALAQAAQHPVPGAAVPAATPPRATEPVERPPFELDGAAHVDAPVARRSTLPYGNAGETPRAPLGRDLPRRPTVADIAHFISRLPDELADADVDRICGYALSNIMLVALKAPLYQHQARLSLLRLLDDALGQKEQSDEVFKARQRVADAVPALNLAFEKEIRDARLNAAIIGQGQYVDPPKRVAVTLQHVERALDDMLKDAPAEVSATFASLTVSTPKDLFQTVGSSHRQNADPRFASRVHLMPKGRELLQSYYGRKYQANIAFYGGYAGSAIARLPDFVKNARQTPGDVRQALFMGHAGAHGSLLVYVREGTDEAVLWFDSAAETTGLDVSPELAKACAPLARNGKPIQVFKHTQALQGDSNSCWVYAMKTAVTLTGKRQGKHGPGDFLMPGLIANLGQGLPPTAIPQDVPAVWASPEIARMSQTRQALMAYADDELDQPLHGMKSGTTLRTFLQKYTYEKAGGNPELDYMRQKGERLAEIVEIEAWSQEIGKAVPKQAWGPKQQTDFAERMKTLVRKKPAVSAVQ